MIAYDAPVTTPPTLDETVVAAMAQLRDHRRAEREVLQAKRQALAGLVHAGVAKRRVHEHVCRLLVEQGWSAEDIASVGVSAPQVRSDLGRILV